MEGKHYLSFTAKEIDRRLSEVDEIPKNISQLNNDVGFITKNEIPKVELPEDLVTKKDLQEKQDVIENLDTIIEGAAKGATALQSIPDEYITETELNEVLESKQNTLTEGEGIRIVGNTISCIQDKTLYKVVAQLPEVGEEHKIYLTVSEEQGDSNTFTEYAYINNAWEVLGEYKATVDLTSYAKKTDIPTTKNILDSVYPVGAIYVSTVETDPAVLFGFGTWEQIRDVFLLAAGDKYLAGYKGGEETHTLTASEMPRHNHMVCLADSNGGSLGGEYTCIARDSFEVSENGWGDTTMLLSSGKSEPHNNMPPYLTVYMWQRLE